MCLSDGQQTTTSPSSFHCIPHLLFHLLHNVPGKDEVEDEVKDEGENRIEWSRRINMLTPGNITDKPSD